MLWETVPCRRSCVGKASLSKFDACPWSLIFAGTGGTQTRTGLQIGQSTLRRDVGSLFQACGSATENALEPTDDDTRGTSLSVDRRRALPGSNKSETLSSSKFLGVYRYPEVTDAVHQDAQLVFFRNTLTLRRQPMKCLFW